MEAGFQSTEALERRLVLCVKRDIGPEKRALEVRLDELDDLLWDVERTKPSEPMKVAWSYA